MTTDELVRIHASNTRHDVQTLALVVPLAIDAVYAARDAGGTMHDAGAEAAVAVLDGLAARALASSEEDR